MRASVAFAGVALAIAFACLESVLSQAVEASDSLQKSWSNLRTCLSATNALSLLHCLVLK